MLRAPPSPPAAPPAPHLLFLVLPRPRRSDACPVPPSPALLPGEGTGTGSAATFSGRLCRWPLSEMLPWEESEEVDSVHEAYREGSFESERLGFLLAREKEGVSWRSEAFRKESSSWSQM